MKATNPEVSDALANERTYLAYIRTALAFVAFGFVVARFALFSREISVVAHITIPHAGISRAFGTAMVILGAIVGIGGGVRYAAAERGMREGRATALPPQLAYLGATLIAGIAAVVAIDVFRF
ncbi:MAG TPA: DUF202 domain-containing protein [Candidatus Tyrphobacter sp.]